MLNSFDFIVLPKDNSEGTWIVILDGVTWDGFTDEEEARGFIEFLVTREITKDACRKQVDELRDDFEVERENKKSSQSFSMG